MKFRGNLNRVVTALMAASPTFPVNCPTMTESVIVYNCWIRLPSIMGRIKARMPFVMFPEVRLLFSAKAITVLFLLELYRNGYPLALYKNGGFCQYAGGEKPCVISETENPKNDDAQTAELVYDRKKENDHR